MPNFSIQEILAEKAPPVTIIDVGAMLEGKNRFDGLLEKGLARVIGFEPDPTEYQKLKPREDERHAFLPYFVGNGKSATFHRCRYNGCSSLYRPNRKLLDLFTSLGDPANGFFEVLSTSEVMTVRLDDIEEAKKCDFLKVDVQGAELDVLKGASRTLGHAAVVELEVEFVPLYEDQPLFAEIDSHMRSHGFLLHKFADIAGRAMQPFTLDQNPFKPLSQVLWANAVYIKDFTRFDQLSSDMLLKTAVVLHEVYASIDMAAFALKAYDAGQGTHLNEDYMAKISATAHVEYSFLNIV